jgi:hypothetical protein
LKSIKKAESTKYFKPTEMFHDVYDKPSELLLKQKSEFLEHIKAYKEHYPLDKYDKI